MNLRRHFWSWAYVNNSDNYRTQTSKFSLETVKVEAGKKEESRQGTIICPVDFWVECWKFDVN